MSKTAAIALSLTLGWTPVALAAPPEPAFVDVTAAAGLAYEHGYLSSQLTEPRMIAGGVAAGDIDRDGWVDLYVVRGDAGANLLLRNRGDGTFEDIAQAAGVAVEGEKGSGPSLLDWNGDGWLDLLVGGVEGTTPRLFEGRGDGTFSPHTQASGLWADGHTFSAGFGDLDGDHDLDLVLTHWGTTGESSRQHLWLNDGDGVFTARTDQEAGLTSSGVDFSFTPNLADIDGDGDLDLLMAADFGKSRVYHNRGDGTFHDLTGAEISDENGMGAAVADYDADGDLDWFVSSIWDPDGVAEANWGTSGNRLYRNRGDGTFDEVTEETGVRRGYWGWGSCFADFDNDGRLDIFHTNGFQAPPAGDFFADPSRLFLGQQDGTFVESSAALGLVDTGQGRGVVCFDYDRDGDIDLLVANNQGPPALYRNDLPASRSFLAVRLEDEGPNVLGYGAELTVCAGGHCQLRVLGLSMNFASQQPAEVHFGLGDADLIDELRVRWPDGQLDVHRGIAPGHLTLGRQAAFDVPATGTRSAIVLALLLACCGLWRHRHRRQHYERP